MTGNVAKMTIKPIETDRRSSAAGRCGTDEVRDKAPHVLSLPCLPQRDSILYRIMYRGKRGVDEKLRKCNERKRDDKIRDIFAGA